MGRSPLLRRLMGEPEETITENVSVVISGFVSVEAALRWVKAYEGGVEQNMAEWFAQGPEELPSQALVNMNPSFMLGNGWYRVETGIGGESVHIEISPPREDKDNAD